MRYLYDPHVHTCQASRCGRSTGAEIAAAYAAAGYAGIIVTDHFLNGWTAVPAGLPWEERIRIFCSGYEEARRAGERLGLQVFLGWEYCDNGSEFLTYGLNADWQLEHPDLLSWSTPDYLRAVHRAGGFLSHAHPFRRRPDIPPVRLYPELCDAAEVFNGGNGDPSENAGAAWYARQFRLLHTAGSDTHWAGKINPGAMAFPRRLDSIRDFIGAMRDGEGEIIETAPESLIYNGNR